jgi:hypothetical protein
MLPDLSPGLAKLIRRHPSLAPRLFDGADRQLLASLLFAYDIATTLCEDLDADGRDPVRLEACRTLRDEAEQELLGLLRPPN